MGRIVFGIVAATIGIVVLNKVFKDGGEEIISGSKAASKKKNLPHLRLTTCKSRFSWQTLRLLPRERFHNGNTGFILIENIENLLIGIGNSLQCRIKQSCKIILILTFGKIRYQMLFLQYNSVEHHIAHFLVLPHRAIAPMLRRRPLHRQVRAVSVLLHR